jgi:hypothetical protein
MSQLCSLNEINKKFDDLWGAYSLADQWERGDALRLVLTALRRLNYFTVTSSCVLPKNNPMAEIKGRFSLAKRLPELVQVDLLTVWRESQQGLDYVYHAFTKSSFGFSAQLMSVRGQIVSSVELQVFGSH